MFQVNLYVSEHHINGRIQAGVPWPFYDQRY